MDGRRGSESTTVKPESQLEAAARSRPKLSKYAPLTTHGLPRAPSLQSGETTSPHRFASSPDTKNSPAPSIVSSLHIPPATVRIAANTRTQAVTTIGDGKPLLLQKVPSCHSVDSSPLTGQSDVFSYKQISSPTSSLATSIAPPSPTPGKIGLQRSRTSSPVSPSLLRSPVWPSSASLNATVVGKQPPLLHARSLRLNTSTSNAPITSQARSSPSRTRPRPPPLELPKYTSSRVAKHVKTKPNSPRHLSPRLNPLSQSPTSHKPNQPPIYYSDLPLRRVEVTLPDRYQNASPRSPMLARLSQRFKHGLRSHFHRRQDSASPTGKENENATPKMTLRERRKAGRYDRPERDEEIEEVAGLHWTEM